MDLQKRMEEDAALIEGWLADYIDGLWPYGKLSEAMGYSLLSGGKRIRPILTLEACLLCGGEAEVALPLACALEMVHTYSLIHDDLPAMDNDNLRRGRPTNHRVYGEATAILAGDALLTAAFEVISDAQGLTDAQRLEAVRCLSQAAGPGGMVAGQVLDMDATGRSLTFPQIQKIEALKTGCLITAALTLGCIAAGEKEEKRQALEQYAKAIGLAFQIQDDILDQEGDEAELGKPIGSDHKNEKATFVSLLGIAACRDLVAKLTQEALDAVKPYEESTFLCQLAQMLADRRK